MIDAIFREYDIRGIAGTEIREDDVELIGRGIGTFMVRNGSRRLTVGRDCRLTGDAFCRRLIAGLTATGCHVTDIGVCPTPVLYFSIHHLGREGGVMVTASHNPPQYNGFKICKNLDSVHGKQIQEIRTLIKHRDFETGDGALDRSDVIPAYRQFIADRIRIDRPLKVGVDAGNGTAGVVALPLLKQLNCQVHDIYCDMDGRFPHHEADPTVLKNLGDLIALVREKKLDLGIGYDGDGDRIGVVDETGRVIYGDQLMIIFSREILSRKPGAVFISEVKCSQTMYDDIKKHGGNPIMWKTGHSLIKEKMKIEKAELAGEMSGHMFFADRYLGYDDAVYATCRLLEILASGDIPLSGYLKDVPKAFNTPEIRVDCPDDQKFELVARVTHAFRKTHDVIDIDGARILFADGWGLVRASNTQPALVLRFEALTADRLSKIRDLVESELEKIKADM
jgi:phosphomannomutase / phosphoglucomutase